MLKFDISCTNIKDNKRESWGGRPVWPDVGIKSCQKLSEVAQKGAKAVFT